MKNNSLIVVLVIAAIIAAIAITYAILMPKKNVFIATPNIGGTAPDTTITTTTPQNNATTTTTTEIQTETPVMIDDSSMTPVKPEKEKLPINTLNLSNNLVEYTLPTKAKKG